MEDNGTVFRYSLISSFSFGVMRNLTGLPASGGRRRRRTNECCTVVASFISLVSLNDFILSKAKLKIGSRSVSFRAELGCVRQRTRTQIHFATPFGRAPSLCIRNYEFANYIFPISSRLHFISFLISFFSRLPSHARQGTLRSIPTTTSAAASAKTKYGKKTEKKAKQFRFNVSYSFPRWPLKVWRTTLDAVQFNFYHRQGKWHRHRCCCCCRRRRRRHNLGMFARSTHCVCVCSTQTTATTAMTTNECTALRPLTMRRCVCVCVLSFSSVILFEAIMENVS